MRKNIIFLLLLVCTFSVKAQDFYVGANISKTFSMSENMRANGLYQGYPGINVNIGDNFTRVFGMRLSLGANPQFGYAGKMLIDAFPKEFKRYDFLTLSGYADIVLNLTELFLAPDHYRTDALYFVLGGGALKVSNFSDNVHGEYWNKYYPVDTKGGLYGVAHLGFGTNLKLSGKADFNLELKYNFVADKYNGVSYGGKYDGYIDLNIGVNWFFSRRYKERNMLDVLPFEIMPIPLKEQYNEGQRMQNGVSFYFGFSDVSSKQWDYVMTVANFLKDNPSLKLIVHGYADKEYKDSYYIERNQKLAQDRAQSVVNLLVKKYGVSADRLSVVAHQEPLEGSVNTGEWIRAVEFEMTK